MATVWITYAWADNEHGDIDFLAQELGQAGLMVKLDRWNIGAGRRLWQQIERFICGVQESDAWLLVATNSSLASEPCKEEFAYALDRALRERGETFPIIALFLSHADRSIIPAGITTRLHVSITDPDWKERIVAAAEGRQHLAARPTVQPYYLKIHRFAGRPKPIAVEVRPRAGVWAPFFAGVPLSERKKVDPSIMIGPRDLPTSTGVLTNWQEGESKDGTLWLIRANNQSTPTESYYVWCNHLPSRLVFGVSGQQPQFDLDLGDRGG